MARRQPIAPQGLTDDADKPQSRTSGEFVDLNGERFYVIRNVNQISPFFMSVISNDDHWLFASSTGGLTAGRVSPSTALFPYVTVDKIHDSTPHTGSTTVLRIKTGDRVRYWEPFSTLLDRDHKLSRNLYKNVLGNKICFEEVNHSLGLTFRYTWLSSHSYGFARMCELENQHNGDLSVEVLDGLQNLLPAGTPRVAQTNSSNLVDAYKWTELDSESGLALFTLYSGITDRAEPCESLRANTAFCLGLKNPTILLSNEQLDNFRRGQPLTAELLKRGIRGAYLVNASIELRAGTIERWQIIANTEQAQGDVVRLQQELKDPEALATAICDSIEQGSDELARIMASSDARQATAEETVSTHHHANVVFNVLRGGVFFDGNQIDTKDLRRTIRSFNSTVYRDNQKILDKLPGRLSVTELLQHVGQFADKQLQRLCYEYLPITFGRRHGDPSRPWNQFAIRLRDRNGGPLLSYEGNWRDIFQNWEALAFSFPEFVESIIAKFVNASTIDGYNPYRITKEGIDWEVEEPDDPWSYIGYWGDHQIIYLQKLLELSQQFHPERLGELLRQPVFSYANVPYRIRPFAALLENPKSTVDFDQALADRIEARVHSLGADGKLVAASDGSVYQVNLLEKLLVPLLAKLGNLVVDGGIWMNTQRPEWNDANNALVGNGLSMVTLCYLRRYLSFLTGLLADDGGTAEISTEVARWHKDTAHALAELRPLLGNGTVTAEQRFNALSQLGQAASDYRESVYMQEGFSAKAEVPMTDCVQLLTDALAAVDHSISTNKRDDGLLHAYNLLDLAPSEARVERLYPMLEGQVAALSTGVMDPQHSIEMLEGLYASSIYRQDQQTFMLYPDRQLSPFLEKNRIPADQLDAIPLLRRLVDAADERLVTRDANGDLRFAADLVNAGTLINSLEQLVADYGENDVLAAREPLKALYESVFDHQAFTGRSGTMFGFEGLGCVYWHMVAKLLLAVQESFFQAVDGNADAKITRRLGELYYQVRKGIGFNKTPAEFGAFPTDPYSHTPGHRGAQQPGMTGQVKEEILTRFGELGVRISAGKARFEPRLLRRREFLQQRRQFSYVNVDSHWQQLDIEPGQIAFTWCQVPIVYSLHSDAESSLSIILDDGNTNSSSKLKLSRDVTTHILRRSGHIRRLDIRIQETRLFDELTS